MKVTYTLHSHNANQQYIQIEAVFPVSNSCVEVFLPTWRPGRYELGNFAKNVKHIQVFGPKNEPLEFRKTSHSVWQIETNGISEFRIVYQYYAADLNAGSTFLSPEQLYVNPVNCFLFTDETKHLPIEVELKIPEQYEIACNLEQKNHTLFATSFDELADSPFIASPSLEHQNYEVGGTLFHIWFQGLSKIDWERLQNDFQKFTAKQIEKFQEFPVKEYHFLFQIVPYKAYHGVEHCASTVILLGPSYAVFDDFYTELLGVSSHELYHTWNVKSIRPIEMFPYDFKKENYSDLGYICEGITTYMGDLFLMKSGVFTFEQYLLEFNKQLQKHFDNHGRFNYSVAESSFDTWLDGYQVGAPGRKVSIYTEGCLLAFVTDIRIRRATDNKFGLDDLMRKLYFNYAVEGKGVSGENYKYELENLTGEDWTVFFKEYINGTKSFEVILSDVLEYIGLELMHQPSESYSEAHLGIKTMANSSNFIITSIFPGSICEMAGVMLGDEIIGVNKYACQGELNKWLEMHDDETKVLTIQRKGRLIELSLPVMNRTFFNTYFVQEIKEMDHKQKRALEHWKK